MGIYDEGPFPPQIQKLHREFELLMDRVSGQRRQIQERIDQQLQDLIDAGLDHEVDHIEYNHGWEDLTYRQSARVVMKEGWQRRRWPSLYEDNA